MNDENKVNNPFAQAIYDCRDVLLPSGKGKSGQRRRTNLRNILFTIATQGSWEPAGPKAKNGLWWTQPRLSATLGIGKDQLKRDLDWLVDVGLVGRKQQLNRSSILWVRQTALRKIVQRQLDDRSSYFSFKEQELNAGVINEKTMVAEFDPEDLEEIYFTAKEVISEALPEALCEEQSEALAEALPESHAEEQTEEQLEAQAGALAEAQTTSVSERPHLYSV